MQVCTQQRGTKRNVQMADWGWLEEADNRRSEHQFYKTFLYDLDAHVFEAIENCGQDQSKIQETVSLWMPQYFIIPSHFIVKFHDLVHPMVVDRMLETGKLTQDQHRACHYSTGYPCNLYFGNNTPFSM